MIIIAQKVTALWIVKDIPEDQLDLAFDASYARLLGELIYFFQETGGTINVVSTVRPIAVYFLRNSEHMHQRPVKIKRGSEHLPFNC